MINCRICLHAVNFQRGFEKLKFVNLHFKCYVTATSMQIEYATLSLGLGFNVGWS